jgi:hypothetical protein
MCSVINPAFAEIHSGSLRGGFLNRLRDRGLNLVVLMP